MKIILDVKLKSAFLLYSDSQKNVMKILMQRRWSNNILILLRTLQTTKFFHLTAIFFPTKTLYIRFLSVYNSHINKLCKLYFLARSNCTSIFHAFNSFSYIWNGQFTVKIKLISIWLATFSTKNYFHFLLYLQIFKLRNILQVWVSWFYTNMFSSIV